MTDSSSDDSSSLSTPPSPTMSDMSLDSVSVYGEAGAMAGLSLKDSVTEEERAAASKFKAEANKKFQSQDFKASIDLYTKALEQNPLDATIFCNRAFARMKVEEHGFAMTDATRAIELDPAYVKAYYRRALCYLSVLQPQKAVADFRKILALEPSNALARSQLDAATKLVKRIAFEKAIDAGSGQSFVDKCTKLIQDGACEPEVGYVGPPMMRSADGSYEITKEFVDAMVEWYKEGKSIPRRFVWEIILGCHALISKEETLTDVILEEGVTCDVIGDTHGQFYDLLHLLSLTGPPSEKHCLLFNGDFVDRGSWSVEIVTTLFAYKWLYPNRVFLNRGNHEAKDLNKVYGFEGECKHKLGEMTYNLFEDVFTALPLSTLISCTLPPSSERTKPILSPEGKKRFFVVHGGLFSKDGVTLNDIRQLQRFGKQPGSEGLMCEMLWTDPQPQPGRGPSKRGVGLGFGPDVTRRWCELNGVTGILRSHEVRQEGYEIEHGGLCTTVFSAPNYCDQTGNKGAFIRIDARGDRSYHQFGASPHPPMRPMAYSNPGMFGLGGLM